jgi:hypothetical protein
MSTEYVLGPPNRVGLSTAGSLKNTGWPDVNLIPVGGGGGGVRSKVSLIVPVIAVFNVLAPMATK